VIGNRKSKHFHVYEEPMYGYLDAWLRDDALVIFDTVKQAEEAAYKSYKLGPQKSIMSAQEVERAIAELTDAILPRHDRAEGARDRRHPDGRRLPRAPHRRAHSA
jgi:hypothetical protein